MRQVRRVSVLILFVFVCCVSNICRQKCAFNHLVPPLFSVDHQIHPKYSRMRASAKEWEKKNVFLSATVSSNLNGAFQCTCVCIECRMVGSSQNARLYVPTRVVRQSALFNFNISWNFMANADECVCEKAVRRFAWVILAVNRISSTLVSMCVCAMCKCMGACCFCYFAIKCSCTEFLMRAMGTYAQRFLPRHSFGYYSYVFSIYKYFSSMRARLFTFFSLTEQQLAFEMKKIGYCL